MTTIEFLRSGTTPSDREEARLLRRRVGRFTLVKDQLYKKVLFRPLLKCVRSEDADYILQEVHQGSCGGHLGGRALARKILLGGQFAGRKLKEWCEEYGIQHAFTSVVYPQSNGQVEVANREILRILRVRLDHIGGSWVDELPGVLWAIRTTPKEGTGITPFHLVYGDEAIVPVEVGVESNRIQHYSEDNAERRLLELDFVDETRDKEVVRLMAYR
ncbi:uncharacterized protein LOC121978541 [Zingiber officinale]|uniref:uncharacterized protein LOC121978541 n=1 Tax=Zingiber officinale TaxID=94328 RepID=UPI001C4BFD9B|nr:uncharacterized protein LOC121978541 [Zingiber officinale]